MACVFIFTDINPNRAVCGRHITFTTRNMLNIWHGGCSPSVHHNPQSKGTESSPRTTVCKPLTCNIDRGAARFSCCVAWHAKWKTCHHQWVTGYLKWAFPREVTAPTHCASLLFLIHLLRSVTVWLSHSTYITNMNVTYVGPGTNKRGGEGFFYICYSRGNFILYTLMVFDIVHSLLSEQDSCSLLPSTITDDPRCYLWGTLCQILIPRDVVTVVCCNTFQLQGLPKRLCAF